MRRQLFPQCDGGADAMSEFLKNGERERIKIKADAPASNSQRAFVYGHVGRDWPFAGVRTSFDFHSRRR